MYGWNSTEHGLLWHFNGMSRDYLTLQRKRIVSLAWEIQPSCTLFPLLNCSFWKAFYVLCYAFSFIEVKCPPHARNQLTELRMKSEEMRDHRGNMENVSSGEKTMKRKPEKYPWLLELHSNPKPLRCRSTALYRLSYQTNWDKERIVLSSRKIAIQQIKCTTHSNIHLV